MLTNVKKQPTPGPFKVFLSLFLCTLLLGCMSTSTKRETLASIDFADKNVTTLDEKPVANRSAEEIKAAYYRYLNQENQKNSSRQQAMSRLAQMELELTNKLIRESEADDIQAYALYNASLQKTISLLTTSLRDFPNAKDNDKLLYQLARTYNQLGDYNKELDTLKQLASGFKSSPYYAETQFRLGEAAFVRQDYLSAEDAYTETIISPNADKFAEKAFFKRGWTRYKQELYIESVDDYVESLALQRFGDIDALEANEKTVFDEYLRAIGLAFSHLNGAASLQEYFSNDTNFKYLFAIYKTVSDVFLKQERYTDAVDTLEQYMVQYPNKKEVPKAKLAIINIWQQGGFEKQVHQSIESLYASFNPNAPYWGKPKTSDHKTQTLEALKIYIAEEAKFYHAQYQSSKKPKNKAGYFTQAEVWYNRYLTHFSQFGRKEGIYAQYAQLLYSAKHYEKALPLLEIAAFDGELILDKNAALLAVNTTNKLYQNTPTKQQTYLPKLVAYSTRFINLYPNDKQSANLGIYAAQVAFKQKLYDDVLRITQALPSTLSSKNAYTINLLKARTFFDTALFSDAENTYASMLNQPMSRPQKKTITDNLALSIYKQAEIAKSQGDINQTIYHFTRIYKTSPQSTIAATGLYDGIALAMENAAWQDAITFINVFKKLYPNHQYKNDVTKKLSVAYLQSDQTDKAAQQFEQISSFEKDAGIQMAALWQAAKLYDKKGDTQDAIRSYRNLANKHTKPFAQNMEAMYKLTELYGQTNDKQKQSFWLRKILNKGINATQTQKTERTDFISAISTLALAKSEHAMYSKRKLRMPLKANLRKKKTSMQSAIKFYGQASSFGLADITTQSTYAIGKIYQDFAVALLDSERPSSLKGEELEQYEILLEDQAFPFEDKAIEFFETNIARSKDGIYNEWLSKSRDNLSALFPVRYARKPKISGYIQQ